MAERKPSDVLRHFATRMDAITGETVFGGFRQSPYRLELVQEPDEGCNGMYYVDMPSIGEDSPYFGVTERIHNSGTVVVQVAYFRGGGDAGSGDRQSVTRNAADDMQRISDMITNPSSYDGANTGIRNIRGLGAARVAQTAGKDLWECRFAVQWQSDLLTT